jgi:Astacin (Peptidase family M12A)/Bacterial pre-peptidase C-terminal domain
MTKAPKMCFDRLLPNDLRQEHRVLRSYMAGRDRAISLIGKQWVNGSTITIRFMSGTAQQKDMVTQIAPEWTKHANLTFQFTEDPTAKIRVTFDSNDGAWSYVGTDNLNIPLHAATLNLGWQDEGVILHEFGHMIGLSHEHQNPDGGIQWNEQAVIQALAGPPNFWDEATVRHNVLDKYRADQLHGTAFDPNSIMLYAFPAAWTTNGFATHANEKLSDLDRMFIQGAKMYPKIPVTGPAAVVLPVSQAAAATIGGPGEIDLYTFTVTNPGAHKVETTGPTDLVMSLFGPNSPTTKVAEDDDSGAGHNALISANLTAGAYFVQVRHFSAQNTGGYSIQVTR